MNDLVPFGPRERTTAPRDEARAALDRWYAAKKAEVAAMEVATAAMRAVKEAEAELLVTLGWVPPASGPKGGLA